MIKRIRFLGILVSVLAAFLTPGSGGRFAPLLAADVRQVYFQRPWGAFVDKAGRIYVTDTGNNRIVRVDDMTGAGLTILGTEGSGVNQFRGPTGIFVDDAGRIYVADSGNNRIVRMNDMMGAGWTSLGESGGVNRFQFPHGVFIDKAGHIYVADENNNRIVRVNDMAGSGWITVGAGGSGVNQFYGVDGVFVDGAGRIYATDYGNNRIVRMDDMTGAGWTTLDTCPQSQCSRSDKIGGPRELFVDGAGRIYVTDSFKNRIVRVEDMTGAGWTTLSLERAGVKQFVDPVGVFVDKAGRIYAVEGGKSRVVRMDDITGAGEITLGAPGWFHASGIFVDEGGRIYVTDDWNNRIVRVDDTTGAGWTTFGGEGAGINEFERPVAVSVDGAGRIYIADSGNSRVVRVDDMIGTGWTTLGSQGPGVNQFRGLSGLFVDRTNRIYVTDGFSHRIWRVDDMTGAGWTIMDTTAWAVPREPGPRQMIDASGIYVDLAGRIYVTTNSYYVSGIVRMNNLTGSGWTMLGAAGTGANKFEGVYGIFVDRMNRIFVADSHNHRIVRMNDMTGAGWTTLGTCPLAPSVQDKCTGVGQFFAPSAIFVDELGRIYVADNNRVVRVNDMTGDGWTTMEAPASQ